MTNSSATPTPDASNSPNIANLQTPLQLPDFDTPNFTSSLTYTPSALALSPLPAAAATGVLTDIFFNLNLNMDGSTPSDAPPPDIHRKLNAGTPLSKATNMMEGIDRAFSASKALQQVLGLQDPVPFVRPPEVPMGLEQEFNKGLKEYGWNHVVQRVVEKARVDVKSDMVRGSGMLEGIKEEKEAESPVKKESRIDPLTWEVADQAVEGKRYNFLGNASHQDVGGQIVANNGYTGQADVPPANRPFAYVDSSSGTASSKKAATVVFDGLDFGSSIRLAESHPSRAKSLTDTTYSFNPMSLGDNAMTSAHISSFSRALDYGHSNNGNGAHPQLSQQGTDLFPPLRRDLYSAVPVALNNYGSSSRHASGNAVVNRGASSGTLFPSPRLEKQSWDTPHTNSKDTPHDLIHESHRSHDAFFANLFTVPRAPVPSIAIQAPSPTKPLKVRKRGPSTSGESMFGPPLSKARSEDNSGLPILPADTEALWKFKFPGNTHALLTILLSWSKTMWKIYRQLPDPKLFSIHPAFPYPITAPLQKRLVSVGFYDTSTEPHKEIRFVGPGDVAQITFNEVDTFKNQDDTKAEVGIEKQDGRISGLTKNFKLENELGKKDIHNLAVHQYVTTGQGRWAYILIKGHKPTDGSIPPHIIIAWHVSATTDTSTCLHTILSTGSSRIPRPTNPIIPLKRFISLQNLSGVLCAPRQQLHQALRSPSRSDLPTVDTANLKQQDGGQTLQRTVMKFQKAGGVPLIEGFKVDVAAFRAWLDAVGRGQGKVIMWAEKAAR